MTYNWIGPIARAVSTESARQLDYQLRLVIEAGINPDDYVLEQGPLTPVRDGDTITFKMPARLRPKTDPEREAERRYTCSNCWFDCTVKHSPCGIERCKCHHQGLTSSAFPE